MWLRPSATQLTVSPELASALSSCKHALWGVALTSGVVSVLYLTGSFYMLEIYDRVIPSRSVPTLVGLSILALVLYGFQGILDMLRTRILVRIGAAVDAKLSHRVFDTLVELPLRLGRQGDGLQPLRDLDQIRSFLSSLGLTALFDLPWLPIYVAICFAFHPLIGVAALAGAVILVALTFVSEKRVRDPMKKVAEYAMGRNAIAETGRRNAEALHAMGMTRAIAAHWQQANSNYMETQRHASDSSGGISAFSKVMRMAIQSGVLGLGAWLVINQQASAGVIIASSIIVARALAPVELAIAHWKTFVSTRQAWRRLDELLARFPPQAEAMELPRPKSKLAVEKVTMVPAGGRNPVVFDVNFSLNAGMGLGIIGPTGSGKSSLARGIVGAWPAAAGKVRLDGAALEQWDPAQLGKYIGYLPQDVELFAGTIAQNISRFEPQPQPQAVIAAARAAGLHELILRLPNGYETQIGEGGAALSAGQRQRVGLARALYGDPFLVVLDEPNSNLDTDGDRALVEAMLGVRARGGIVVVIAHRQIALAAVDLVLVMSEGRMQALGPKDEILNKLQQHAIAISHPAPVTAPPASSALRVVNEGHGS